MAQLAALNADCLRRALAYLTHLDLLRVCRVSARLLRVSSTNHNHQWRSIVELSDRLRKNIFPRHKMPTYPPLARLEAVARLKRRCKWCRASTRYVCEFDGTRVCEKCEEQRRSSDYRMLTQSSAAAMAVNLDGLASITRGTGRDEVTLYLAEDVRAAAQPSLARQSLSSSFSSSSSSSDSEEEVWMRHPRKSGRGRGRGNSKAPKGPKGQPSSRKNSSRRLGRRDVWLPVAPPRADAPRGRKTCGRHYGKQKAQRQANARKWAGGGAAGGGAVQKAYERSVSGMSCLVLAD